MVLVGKCLLLFLTFLAASRSRVNANDFEPYALNGGLVSAIAGDGFVVTASDTRMIGPGGYILQSRNHLSNRLWEVGGSHNDVIDQVESTLRSQHSDDGTVKKLQVISYGKALSEAPILVGSAGCSTDCEQLKRVIRADVRASSYLGQLRAVEPDQVANLLSQVLYLRRGFPYYAFCVVAGMDLQGCGKVYVYDAIGSYEQVAVAATGTGREALQPILDRLFSANPQQPRMVEGTSDEAVKKLCQAYRSVSEREIGVGDKLVLHIVEKNPTDGTVDCRLLVVPMKEH